MSTTSTDLLFSALADPNRRLIVEQLAGEGPATATDLAGRLGVTRQGAAKHLASLAEAGIVVASREGREVRYEFVDRGLEPGQAWLDRVGSQWDRRLARLRSHLDD